MVPDRGRRIGEADVVPVGWEECQGGDGHRYPSGTVLAQSPYDQAIHGPGGRLRLKQPTELDLQLRRQGRQPLETGSSSGGTATSNSRPCHSHWLGRTFGASASET